MTTIDEIRARREAYGDAGYFDEENITLLEGEIDTMAGHDIDTLLAEVDRLRAEVARLRGMAPMSEKLSRGFNESWTGGNVSEVD